MLMWLGYLMIASFMILIMTRRMSALVALILVPLAFGLLAGHTIDLGPMAVSGIVALAPTATVLLFAVLYFAIMIDAGLFDPLVDFVLRIVGEDPVRVAIGTALVAMIVSLDGDGATSALITITAFLPVYRRLGMNPLILATLLGLSITVTNLTPWGGPTARVASALQLELLDVFAPLIPAMLCGLASTILIAWYLGRGERSRLAEGCEVVSHVESAISFDRDPELTRPKLFLVNLFLTLILFAAVLSGAMPLPITFMIGFSIAMIVNYPSPSQQRARLQSYAGNALPIVLLILAAGAFTGVLAGTGMTDAMAQGAMALVPEALGPWLGIVTAFLSAPLTFALSNDAYYFGVVPVIAETASNYGVEPVIIARASLLAGPIHGLSPLVAALYLIAGLIGCEVGSLQRFALKWAMLVTLTLIAAAVLTGAIT
ncbi:CitMHS family transporter [Novosphingopyxis sp.]|uniref:CitMHS family transporter n=1 Tax=Novosphingopyxis sp. TaxID=2709690 RepID=UPI003B5ACC58